jgi:glycerophosphoryl diester phosphodiesterase
VNRKLVDAVHAQGRRVHVWTVNPEAEMRRLFAYGVDGIFTDDPSLALKVFAEMREKSGQG